MLFRSGITRLLACGQPPLAEFISQPERCLLSERLPDNQNKVDAPGVMMTFTAVPAVCRLAKLLARPKIGGHDVCQFMQACLFTFTHTIPAVRANLDPALNSVGVAASLSTHYCHLAGVCRKRSREPVHLLDGTDVNCTMPVAYNSAILDKHRPGQLADRQARCQLRVIRCFL